MSKASSLSGNMASAARLAPAASSDASSMVRIFVLTDDRHDHANHELQPPDISGFLLGVTQVRRYFIPLMCFHRDLRALVAASDTFGNLITSQY